MTPEDLVAFEAEVAAAFNAGRIRAPVHLAGGNEVQLIGYFAAHYHPGDWICSAWRSHYHALLAGVPRDAVMEAVLAGRSITLCWPEYRFVTSAIVGGILPVAVGIAMGLRRSGEPGRVHCFLGDMTARTGAFWESCEYASGQGLPVTFIVEDNSRSVGTPTAEVWGDAETSHPREGLGTLLIRQLHVNPWPHAGAGEWVKF